MIGITSINTRIPITVALLCGATYPATPSSANPTIGSPHANAYTFSRLIFAAIFGKHKSPTISAMIANPKIEYRYSSVAYTFEIVYSKAFCNLCTKVKCQKQSDECKQLIIFYNYMKRLFQTCLFCWYTYCWFLFYIEYSNTDCNNENNCDNNCENCISIFCIEITLACSFVQIIDNVKSKCCYWKSCKTCKKSWNYRYFLTFVRVICQVRKPWPVRDIHDRISHSI